jgi:hypothetical protein
MHSIGSLFIYVMLSGSLFGDSYQPPLPAELVKPLADFDEEGGGMSVLC